MVRFKAPQQYEQTLENTKRWAHATYVTAEQMHEAPDGARCVSKKGEVWVCRYMKPGDRSTLGWIRETDMPMDGSLNHRKMVVGITIDRLWQTEVLRALPAGGISQEEMDYIKRSILGGEE